MAASANTLPGLTFATVGTDYAVVANHFCLSFPASSSRDTRWLCWEVDAQWADAEQAAASSAGWSGRAAAAGGQRRPPGKAKVRAALEARLQRAGPLAVAAGGAPLWVYDGVRRLYTWSGAEWSGTLPPGPDDGLTVRLERSRSKEGDLQEVDISRLVEPMGGNGTEEQRFFHVFVRHQAGQMDGHVPAGRKVFIEESHVPRNLRGLPHGDLVQGRTMRLGYLASLERSVGGFPAGSGGCVQLNINVTAAFGIPKQSLQHLIGALCTGKPEDTTAGVLHSFWQPWDRKGHDWMARTDDEHWKHLDWLNREQFGIKKVKVITPYMGRSAVRSVRGISSKPPHALWFQMDGQWTNVQEYFQWKRNISLKFPSLPCVDLGKGERVDWVPLELVDVLGGLHNLTRKVSEEMLDRMVRRLTVKPEVRLEWIRQVLWDLPDLRPLGVQVDWEPLPLSARRLPTPALQCGAQGKGSGKASGKGAKGRLEVRDGFFNPNHVRVVRPPQAPVQWMILNYLRGLQWDDVEVMRREIMETARDRGVNFDPNAWIETHRDERAETSEGLRGYLQQFAHQLHLVVAFLPPKTPVYGQLKAECSALGLHSACLNPLAAGGKGKGKGKGEELAKKKVPMFVNKVLSKLGTLVQLEAPHWLLGADTMVLGADVRHEDGEASIAGAVATFTPPFVHYFSSCRAQMPKLAQQGERQRRSREHIEDLQGMVEELLSHFRRQNPQGRWPGRVLVFRDGVSEGQFAMQQDELLGLYRAFEAQGAPRPKVAWLVVQKRHQTRLFPGQGTEALTNGNVLPGVVADRGIAHPEYENWFAVSHKAIQGTAVPAHYFVLHNTLGVAKDDLIQVTHELCHIYPRASCAVSYPTPAYYADHLCERAFELGCKTQGLTDCAQLNAYFQGAHFRDSRLQGTNFFC